MAEKLLPCPHCGNDWPWEFITAHIAVIRCSDCGAEMKNGAVPVLYKRDKVPAELVGKTYEATALVIKNADGTENGYPDHGYVGVSVDVAFEHAGLTEKWNRRSDAAKDAEIAKLREALEPFATDWADENGWTDTACQKDRVVDWFGPSDFLRVRAALKEKAE